MKESICVSESFYKKYRVTLMITRYYKVHLIVKVFRNINDQPITLLMSYIPAGFPARNLAASIAPLAKIDLEYAL